MQPPVEIRARDGFRGGCGPKILSGVNNYIPVVIGPAAGGVDCIARPEGTS